MISVSWKNSLYSETRSGTDLYDGIAILCTTLNPSFYSFTMSNFEMFRSYFANKPDFYKYSLNELLCWKLSFRNFSNDAKKPLYPLPNLPASEKLSFHSFIESINGSSKLLYIFASFLAIECFTIF